VDVESPRDGESGKRSGDTAGVIAGREGDGRWTND
jgi:hypothetical protein